MERPGCERDRSRGATAGVLPALRSALRPAGPSAGVGGLLGALALLALPAPLLAATLVVDPAGAGDATTLTAALALAADGDLIEVLPGAYDEQLDPGGLAVTLRAVGGPAVTTLTAPTASCVRFVSGEGPDTVLAGFTVTGCSLRGVTISGASPTLRDLVVTGNGGPGPGGGVSVDGGSPTLERVTVLGNAGTTGGGLSITGGADVLATRLVVDANSADLGGGVFVDQSTLTWRGGSSVTNVTSSDGGALAATRATLLLVGVSFEANAAGSEGGALFLSGSDTSLDRVALLANSSARGGALRALPWAAQQGAVSLYSPSVLDVFGARFVANVAPLEPGVSLEATDAAFLRSAFLDHAPAAITDGEAALSVLSAPAPGRPTADSYTDLLIDSCLFAGNGVALAGHFGLEPTDAVLDSTFLGASRAVSTSGGLILEGGLVADSLTASFVRPGAVLCDGCSAGGSVTDVVFRDSGDHALFLRQPGGPWAVSRSLVAGGVGGVVLEQPHPDSVVDGNTFLGLTGVVPGVALRGYGPLDSVAGNVFAWNPVLPPLDLAADPSVFLDNVFWGNAGAPVGGTDPALGNQVLFPAWVAATLNGDWSDDDLRLGPASPLVDLWVSGPFDHDGSPGQPGAFGDPTAWDADGDGVSRLAGDCLDADPSVFPAAPPVVDGLDHDCDGLPEPGLDADGDGFSASPLLPWYLADCDDADPARHPDAAEVCDGQDTDCDGASDEDFDADGDGASPCGSDCDDADPTRFPGALEPVDGVDNDCDGLVDDPEDLDGDGVTTGAGDCDDTNPAMLPASQEWPDGLDNDCDGLVDEGLDVDGDGVPTDGSDCDDADPFVLPGAPEGCDGRDTDCDGLLGPEELDGDGDGLSSCAGDCDDTDPAVSPALPEACDGRDTDCDGVVDEDDDLDGDGLTPCAGDCDDADPAVSPAAPERCNGRDDDCDGLVDDGLDADGDGLTPCAGDCDDAEPAVAAWGETCDGLDNDCDGDVDEPFDRDGDGWLACLLGSGPDCDDLDATAFPGAPERADGLDNDCDGVVDEGLPAPAPEEPAGCSTASASASWAWLLVLPLLLRRRVAALLLLLPLPALAATWTVVPTSPGDLCPGSVTPPPISGDFPTHTAAVAAAADGDVILLHPTYCSAAPLVPGGKALEVVTLATSTGSRVGDVVVGPGDALTLERVHVSGDVLVDGGSLTWLGAVRTSFGAGSILVSDGTLEAIGGRFEHDGPDASQVLVTGGTFTSTSSTFFFWAPGAPLQVDGGDAAVVTPTLETSSLAGGPVTLGPFALNTGTLSLDGLAFDGTHPSPTTARVSVSGGALTLLDPTLTSTAGPLLEATGGDIAWTGGQATDVASLGSGGLLRMPVGSTASVTVDDLVANDISASGDGGVAFVGGGDLLLTSSRLDAASATQGGALAVAGGSLVGRNLLIAGPTASRGGAAWVGGGSASLANVGVTSATAAEGGAFVIDDGALDLSFCTVLGAWAPLGGSQLQADGGSWSATHCAFGWAPLLGQVGGLPPTSFTWNVTAGDPLVTSWIPGPSSADDVLWPLGVSPLVDAGDPALLDPDGTRADVGLSGGPYALAADTDGDGVLQGPDCDDADPDAHPGAPELCDGHDDDCDGLIDEGWDVDADGVAPCAGDCNDGDATIGPFGVELCDGLDQDCDGLVDEGWDVDGDGLPDCDGLTGGTAPEPPPGPTTWTVDPSGGDVPDLEAALAVAADGDVLVLAPIVHPGPVTLANRTLTIEGAGATLSATTGRPLTVVGGAVTVRDLRLTSPVGCIEALDAELSLDGVYLDSCGGAGLDGGGLLATGSAIEGTDLLVDGGRADRGGGLFVEDGSLVVADSTFTDNASLAGEGGAIHAVASEVEVTGSSFDANQPGFSSGLLVGGAVFAGPGSVVNLGGSTFSDNMAVRGGAVAVDEDVVLRVLGCSFSDNTAYLGGAHLAVGVRGSLSSVGALPTADVLVAASTFSGGAPGPLHVVAADTVLIEQTEFGDGAPGHLVDLGLSDASLIGCTLGADLHVLGFTAWAAGVGLVTGSLTVADSLFLGSRGVTFPGDLLVQRTSFLDPTGPYAIDATGEAAVLRNVGVLGGATGARVEAGALVENGLFVDVGTGITWPNGVPAPEIRWSTFWDVGQPAKNGNLWTYPGNATVDPLLTAWSDDGDPTNDDLVLTAASPLVDGGNPALFDPDGSRSDGGGLGGPTLLVDADGDGLSPQALDCDDDDPTVWFLAPELCDGLDNDCDGLVDDGFDDDGDGARSCDGDCDDDDPAVFPGAPEACNGADDDCDGLVDEGWDADGDGARRCDGDCDDDAPATFPGAPEACNGADDDCDDTIDEGFDQDDDGATTCAGDCDDEDPSRGPLAPEVCNGRDDDCDPAVDEGFDRDGDGATTCAGDCDDDDPSVLPGVPEVCDGRDEDCDGLVDDGLDCGEATPEPTPAEPTPAPPEPTTAGCSSAGCSSGGSGGTSLLAVLMLLGLLRRRRLSLLCLLLPALATADTLVVDASGAGDFASIQPALDVALDGDTVAVGPGTWVGPLDLGGRAIALVATDGPATTVLEGAGGPVVLATSGEPLGTSLTGFTIQGGAPGVLVGPGASLLLDGCAFVGNSDDDGGGVRCDGGTVEVVGSAFATNTATFAGGALFADGCVLSVEGSTFDGNTAFSGGALAATASTVTVLDSTFLDHGATFGGALAQEGGALTLRRSTFARNDADVGGAVLLQGVSGALSNTLFDGNTAVLGGGLHGSNLTLSVMFSAFLANDASDGAALRIHGGAGPVHGNLVAFHSGGPAVTTTGVPLDLRWNDAYANGAGSYGGQPDPTGTLGNLSLPPGVSFTADDDPSNDDLHPQPGSPLLDAADPTALDPDGSPADIGVYGGPTSADVDADGDGWNVSSGDCDDEDLAVNPGAADDDCDGVDDDCDGLPDDGSDADADGVTTCAGDCDDAQPTVYPGALDLCDGLDNDCDGTTDPSPDADGDGATLCDGDCDDLDPSVSPVATESCSGRDDDCDGQVDEGFDADADGWTTCAGDCDDTDVSVRPGAPEPCNGVDDDCDGQVDEASDADGDGVTPCAGDCDDTNPAVGPGMLEVCNGIDDDCQGGADDGLVVDADGDGWSGGTCGPTAGDCDDTDPAVAPGAPEVCNGVDDDCDGITDPAWDADGDGASACGGDCDDLNAAVGPSALELCNGRDDDCDGQVDEVADDDGDGATNCDGDCDDADPVVFPGAPEVCNGRDDDCDGLADDGLDADGDGWGDCAGGDCDDGDAAIQPGASELCNGRDDDCDGLADEPFDLDGDGVSTCAGDCDDAHPGVLPGAPEVCNGRDDDCDGLLDDGLDSDGDGVTPCGADGLAGTTDDDCDDAQPASASGRFEGCDGLDNDCDGRVDEGWDHDGDGLSPCAGDCDDGSAAVLPGLAELLDRLDNDCDGQVDEGLEPPSPADADGGAGCALSENPTCSPWLLLLFPALGRTRRTR